MALSEFRYVTTQLYSPVVTITAAASNGIITTYTANNSFTQGQTVTVIGVTPSQFNVTGTITSCTSTFFALNVAVSGTYSSGGTATGINPIIAELPFTNVNFTSQLNSIGTFQGDVLLSGINSTNLNVYNGTIPAKTILWVLYTDPSSLSTIPVWSGVIWSREYDSESQTLMITAQEMISLYQKRRISNNKTYVSQDPSSIAKDLLVYTEAKTYGNTGLTYASVPVTGYLSSRVYNKYEYKSVYQAIKDLAQNYFDFKIQPFNINGLLTNQFKMGVPLGVTYSSSNPLSIVLQFPGNIISYRFPEDGSGASNKLYGLGYGANGTKLIATAVDNSKYTDGFGLLEDSVNYIDVADINLLKDITLGQLNATSYPPTTVEVVLAPYIDPLYPSYSIGDEIRLDIQDDYFPSGTNAGGTPLVMRIVGISVNPGENGPSRVTLTLTRQLAAGSVS